MASSDFSNRQLICKIYSLAFLFSKIYCSCSENQVEKLLSSFGYCLVHIVNYNLNDIPGGPWPLITSKPPDRSAAGNWTDNLLVDLTTKYKNWTCTTHLYLLNNVNPNERFTKIEHVSNSYIKLGRMKHAHSYSVVDFERKPHKTFCIIYVLHALDDSDMIHSTTTFTRLWEPNDPTKNSPQHSQSYVFMARPIRDTEKKQIVNWWMYSCSLLYVCLDCNRWRKWQTVNVDTSTSITSGYLDSYKVGYVWVVYTRGIVPWPEIANFGKNKCRFQGLKHLHPSDISVQKDYIMQALAAAVLTNHTYISKTPSGKLFCKPNDQCDLIDRYPALKVYTGSNYYNLNIPLNYKPYKFLAIQGNRRYKSSIDFKYLLESFDTVTWCMLLFLLVALLIIQYLSTSIFHRCRVAFLFYCILLEQSQKVVTCTKYRHLFLFIGPVLVMSIVLCGLYKGDTIEKLTLPQEHIPYETLSELYRNGFKIYEIAFSYELQLTEAMKSTMPPLMSEAAENILRQRLRKIYEVHEFFDLILRPKEAIAIIHPSSGVYQWAARAREQGIPAEDIHIGKEHYAGSWWGMKLINNPDPEIIDKIATLFENGMICKWRFLWARLLILRKQEGHEKWATNSDLRAIIKSRDGVHKKPKPLTLGSNLQTMFVLFGMGIAGAAVILLGECGRTITKPYKHVLNVIRQSYLFIWDVAATLRNIIDYWNCKRQKSQTRVIAFQG